MGSGSDLKCPRCGYEFYKSSGVGFMFPKVYEETVQKAKNGELGEELKTFLDNNEEGAIDVELVTLCCEECGDLANKKDLTMYLPTGKKPEVPSDRWSIPFSFESAKYAMADDLNNYYVEFAKYPHKCEKCGGSMRKIKDEDIQCPKCKIPMECTGFRCWD